MATDDNFQATSTRPYLIRALHEWCCDNGFTPYISVFVDASVQVPLEYVENQEIVLNIGFDATTALNMSNDYLQFKARFSGAVREVMVPMDHVMAIFSRESGQGMAFPKPVGVVPKSLEEQELPRAVVSLVAVESLVPEKSSAESGQVAQSDDTVDANSGGLSAIKPKPALTRIK